MNISQASKITGLSLKALRFYEEQGIIRPVQRRENGYRVYDAQQVKQLKFIKRVRSLGFSLEEARKLLDLMQGPQCNAAQVKALVETQLQALDVQIEALARQREALTQLSDSCNGKGERCPILTALATDDQMFKV